MFKRKRESLLSTRARGTYTSTIVIWAGGEYQYPKTASFKGDHLCTHYSEISSFSDMRGKDRIVIGAYESGFDSALNLVKNGKKVTLLDGADYLNLVNSDSSYSLPSTRDRIKDVMDDILTTKKQE